MNKLQIYLKNYCRELVSILKCVCQIYAKYDTNDVYNNKLRNGLIKRKYAMASTLRSMFKLQKNSMDYKNKALTTYFMFVNSMCV